MRMMHLRQDSVSMSALHTAEMAQESKAMAALPKEPDSIPSTHVEVHNYL